VVAGNKVKKWTFMLLEEQIIRIIIRMIPEIVILILGTVSVGEEPDLALAMLTRIPLGSVRPMTGPEIRSLII
jgi:hypothetical protein